ncbi:MAG: GNAT family N-acetyltransferase [Polyangiaceae bacterium]
MATKHSKESQTGEVGVGFVSRVATEAGCIYRRFDSADLGIDGAIEFVNDRREPTGDFVLVQVKSGRSHVSGSRYTIRGDREHFETWARYAVPVVGIVHNPTTGEARWVNITEHLRAHPERMQAGPYTIDAPAQQQYSVDAFAALVGRFVRSPTAGTSVEATPNFFIRPWQPADAAQTRVLLSSIGADYPSFDAWLEKQWQIHRVSKKIVDVQGTVAGYSMWTRKDERNVKLQTFMVGPLFRGTSIGPHLLYHELRTWAADENVERVFVTVASSKADLIGYFQQFGFRVEGISANRYPRASGAAELVMAKHFVRRIVRSADNLTRAIDEIAQKIWGVHPGAASPTRFGVAGELCSVPTSFDTLRVVTDLSEATVSPRVQLVNDSDDVVRCEDDASLMRQFYPLRLHLLHKRYVIAPIYSKWVSAMLSAENSATPAAPSNLKLRVDNVYYCYPRFADMCAGDHVIFYEPAEAGGSKSAVGSAIVRRIVTDTPVRLFAEFSDRGVYTENDIRKHTRNGIAVAIHFELFEPFARRVPLAEIRQELGSKANMQGLTKITRDQFERVRARGLSLVL